MDDVFFGAKRAYWATVRFSASKLQPFGTTPARITLLRVIHAARTPITQADVHHRLGVARSVVCRMMRALEKLGLVVRGPRVRRTRACELTAKGRALVETVWKELVHSRVIPVAIDASLKAPQFMRRASHLIFRRLVFSFGRWGLVRAP